MTKTPLPPSRIADQFVVRFPDGMRAAIASSAKENNRSMNAEIIARLEKSFDVNHDALSLGLAIELLQTELSKRGLTMSMEIGAKLIDEKTESP